MNWINDILQCSPPIALALAINAVLAAIRKTNVPGWLKPLFAMAAGGAAYPYIADVSKLDYNIQSPTLYRIIIGVCIGGLSVSLHQVLRQWLKDKTGIDIASSGDTDEINKPPAQPPAQPPIP